MKNKISNNRILAIAVFFLVIAIILVSIATAVDNKKEKKNPTPDVSQSTPAESVPPKKPENVTATPQTTDAPTQNAVASGDIGKYKIATQDDPLSLRDNPDGAQLETIPKGETVEIAVVYDGWGYTTYNNTSGWIAMKYTEFVSPAKTAPKNTIGKYIINTKDDPLGYRSQPDGERIGEIPKGETVEILAVCEVDGTEYGLVKYNGDYGWLNFDLLKAA